MFCKQLNLRCPNATLNAKVKVRLGLVKEDLVVSFHLETRIASSQQSKSMFKFLYLKKGGCGEGVEGVGSMNDSDND